MLGLRRRRHCLLGYPLAHPIAWHDSPRQPTELHGFGKWFTSSAWGGAGAFGEKVVYNTLDHPGPELAQLAEDGRCTAYSIRDPHLAMATFAGGCFWGLELAYQRMPGVACTAVGYTQGKERCPSYHEVCAGATGHTEAVIVYYDPNECSYNSLLSTFFKRVDITTVNGQGNDFG